MILSVRHRTRYVYDEPVSVCHNEARLIPANLSWQTVRTSRIDIEPVPAERRERIDYFGNRVVYFAIRSSHTESSILATHEIEMEKRALPDPAERGVSWEEVRDSLGSASGAVVAAREFLHESPLVTIVPGLTAYAAESFPPGRSAIEAVEDLMHRIHRDFEFDPEATSVATPLTEVFEQRRGVCQDFAHLAVGCLRGLGLPARYVSGYLETLPPPGAPKLQGADASHAWFSLWTPNVGWVDFDATNDQVPNERYVTTAFGRDYSDVAPLKGVLFGGGEHRLEVAVDVEVAGGAGP